MYDSESYLRVIHPEVLRKVSNLIDGLYQDDELLVKSDGHGEVCIPVPLTWDKTTTAKAAWLLSRFSSESPMTYWDILKMLYDEVDCLSFVRAAEFLQLECFRDVFNEDTANDYDMYDIAVRLNPHLREDAIRDKHERTRVFVQNAERHSPYHDLSRFEARAIEQTRREHPRMRQEMEMFGAFVKHTDMHTSQERSHKTWVQQLNDEGALYDAFYRLEIEFRKQASFLPLYSVERGYGLAVAGGFLESSLVGKHSPDIDVFLVVKKMDDDIERRRLSYETISEGIQSIVSTFPDKTVHVSIRHHVINVHVFDSTVLLRKYQFIHRVYDSPAQVIAGFDIDSCRLVTTEDGIWAHRTAMRAWSFGYNLFNHLTMSTTGNFRYAKKMRRLGLDVFVAGLPGAFVSKLVSAFVKIKDFSDEDVRRVLQNLDVAPLHRNVTTPTVRAKFVMFKLKSVVRSEGLKPFLHNSINKSAHDILDLLAYVSTINRVRDENGPVDYDGVFDPRVTMLSAIDFIQTFDHTTDSLIKITSDYLDLDWISQRQFTGSFNPVICDPLANIYVHKIYTTQYLRSCDVSVQNRESCNT